MRENRGLVALVIFMGVLIVIGTTTLVAVIVHRLAHPQHPVLAAGPVPGAPARPGVATDVLQHEPEGTRIGALTRQSDTVLAIALSGGGPDRVLVWDLAAGRKLTEIRLAP